MASRISLHRELSDPEIRPPSPMPSVPEAPAIPAALIGRLRKARSISALTGAGISAESGVPTFRDAQTGMWAQFDPLELATPDAFRRNAKLVWDWYAWRRELIAGAAPNAGHRALAAIEAAKPDFLVITQNVDGLHQVAGSTNVVELHGNIQRVKCSRDGTIVATWDDSSPREAPRCAQCGAFLRPDVVWFEETLPDDALARAEHAARDCDVLLVVGTAAEVYPAAMLPAYARHHGAAIVEINPQPTRLSDRVDFVLRGPSGVVLPALVAAVWGDVLPPS
jgi:NAD-dependent protein deacetylase/lipoamidase